MKVAVRSIIALALAPMAILKVSEWEDFSTRTL
jgi:hypothetical protein